MIKKNAVYLIIAAVLSVSLGTISNGVLLISTASPDSNSGNDSTEGAREEYIERSKMQVPKEKNSDTGRQTETPSASEKPAASELPKCDGSFLDCVTERGDVCLAGEGGHECECGEDMSDCPNHLSSLEETFAHQVIEPCLLDPS